MAFVVKGMSDRSIARQLGMSVTTVRRRVRRFCTRLGVSTRIEAGMEARRRGWL